MDTFNPNQMPPMYGSENKKSLGPLIAVIIILALIIIGGLYFLKERASQKVYPAVNNDSITESLNQQSSSDDLNSIETDLNATDVNNLDEGAAAVEAQLQ
jgi:hypothetical protein